MQSKRSFASDNTAGVHPEVMEAIVRANQNHAIGYGEDEITREAAAVFRRLLSPSTEVFFVYGGTGANTLGLSAVLRPYQAIVCAETSHINVDECGAPEKFSGAKLIDLPTSDGKLTPAAIEPHMVGIGFQHHVQPRVISITQPTELGVLYTLDEIRGLAEYAHRRGMLLHMDGARICNAAAAMNTSFAAMTVDCGVDVLSFGGTKNGMMYGEAVCFLNPALADGFPYIHKQGMQLASKMRFIAAQFIAMLSGDLWLRNARHANQMAAMLADRVRNIPNVRLSREPQVNSLFATIPAAAIEKIQDRYYFYVWDENLSEVRWMTSFDTTEEDIENFTACLKEILSAERMDS